jgi:L-ascorbate 6-phosphate lactonase
VPPGNDASRAPAVELCALGQAGMRLRTATATVLIDPWTEQAPQRLRPAPGLELAAGVDAVLITHEHRDHLDREFLGEVAARSPGVRVALPRLAAPLLDGVVPAEQIVGLDPGDRLQIGGIAIEAIAAFHALEPDEAMRSDRFLGYLLAAAGLSIYHSGDSVVTAELLEALAGRAIDIAFLPINGRDAFRERAGMVGNMSAREAVGLCHALGVRTLVPIHWDLVAGNTERPGAVLDAIAEVDATLHTLVLAHLQPFTVAAAR